MLVPMMAGGRKGTGMLHSTDYARGANSRAEADAINAEIDNMNYWVDYIWTDIGQFHASLRFTEFERAYKGKIACAWFIDDANGDRWPMFMSDLEDYIRNGADGNSMYEPVKRGRVYGIRQI